MAIKIQGTSVIDDTRNIQNIGNITASGSINFTSNESISIPSGTTAERPASPSAGDLRYNTDNTSYEFYDGSLWTNVGTAVTKATLDKTFSTGESSTITLPESTTETPVVSVIKEVPQAGVTSNKFDVSPTGDNFVFKDSAYSTTLTPSDAGADGTFTLGTGSFSTDDIAKRIVGNGGEAILTDTNGSYLIQTAFNDSSTIGAGDWSMFSLDVESATVGLTLSGFLSPPYTIDGASYDNVSFNYSIADASGVELNTDGTKMYILSFQNETVYQYTLSTPFNVSTASYDSISFSVSSQIQNPYDIEFNNDGTAMYVLGSNNSETIYQYSLGTAFDISTASASGLSLDISAQGYIQNGLTFNNDGTKMYMSGAGSSNVYQYTLSTPFNVSTASYDSISFSVSSQTTNNYGVRFNDDGTKMYVADYGGTIYQYSLGTAFNISTASYNNVSYDASAQVDSVLNFTFNADGTKMILLDKNTDSLYQYTILSTIVPTSTNHSAITSTSIDTEFWIDINSMTADDAANDGSVFYAISTDDRSTWTIIDDANGVRPIVRNNSGTWEVNDDSSYGSQTWVAASENDEFSALEESVSLNTAPTEDGFAPVDQWSYDNIFFEIGNYPGDIRFNDDGTKMFISYASDVEKVEQYTLSTAFDLNTASYDVFFDVSGQVSFMLGFEFNNTGTKMYAIDDANSTVYQYTLSTPFELSTTSYDNISYNVDGDLPNQVLESIVFNNDGTKMYLGTTSEEIHQFTLSTPFELSTISYDNVDYQTESDPTDLTFNNNGTKLYAVNEDYNEIDQHDLSTAFDISTASFSGLRLNVTGTNNYTQPKGLTFNNDGTKAYIIYSAFYDEVRQFSSGLSSSINRMDAVQLNDVSDANHYTLANDLDAAIILSMEDGNNNSPTSDGIAVNYDANILNKGAVLGTDYEFDKPTNSQVRITSLSDENLKIRVV